jgi:hypothetical protein
VNWKPTPKVAAGGAAGALTTIIVFILYRFGIEIPGDVALALSTLISFAAAWFTKEQPNGD